jgi:flagellar hook-length control protein FliK
MAITITELQAKLPALKTPANSIATVDSAALPGSAAGADFATLLLSLQAASADLQSALPQDIAHEENDEHIVSTVDTNLRPDASLGQENNALLLAALGLTPPAQPLATQNSIQTSTTSTAELLATQSGLQKENALLSRTYAEKTFTTSASLNDLLLTPASTDPASSISATNRPSFPETSQGAEKPAKLAVADFALPTNAALTDDKVTTDNMDVVRGMPVLQSTVASRHATTDDAAHLSNISASNAPYVPSGTALVTQTSLAIETPVRHSAWANDFSQKIVWLASNDKQIAQITLNPPQMGPIEISLNMNKENASAFFVSPHAEIRDVIETALPRLREMLAGVGIELGQTNVSAESFKQQAENGKPPPGASRWNADNAILDGVSAQQLSDQISGARKGTSLVDLFA